MSQLYTKPGGNRRTKLHCAAIPLQPLELLQKDLVAGRGGATSTFFIVTVGAWATVTIALGSWGTVSLDRRLVLHAVIIVFGVTQCITTVFAPVIAIVTVARAGAGAATFLPFSTNGRRPGAAACRRTRSAAAAARRARALPTIVVPPVAARSVLSPLQKVMYHVNLV